MRLFRSIRKFLDGALRGLGDFLEEHHRPIGWIFSLTLMTGLVAGSAMGLAYFLQREQTVPAISRAEPKTGRKAENLQKELEGCLAQRDFQGARARLNELQALWPGDARLYQAEGAILMGEKRNYEAALAAFQKARELAPKDTELVLNIAEAQFALGRYAEAEDNYRLFNSASPEPVLVPFRRYVCLVKLGREAEAEKIFGGASVAFQSPSWFYIRVFRAAEAGETREARELVRTARLLHGEKTRVFDEALEQLGRAEVVN